jgi:hypothetical protein
MRSAIDPDKLRAHIRRLPGESLLEILDRAIDLLPPGRLARLIKGHVCIETLRPERGGPRGLLASVRRFRDASLNGEYYEDFDVDSRNFLQKSRATQAWIAECQRLFDRCVAAARGRRRSEAREGFDVIFDLLRRVDRCEDDIVFFADEASSWQVGVDRGEVLPAWFGCLAALADPDEYARATIGSVRDFVRSDSDRFLRKAHAAASFEQREALARLESRRTSST